MWLLWIFSSAASSLLPATGEVVNSFQVCPQFFLDGNPPNLVPRFPAIICQFYKGNYRFATMYDKKARIPIFSAYKYLPGESRRRNKWKIEPQLALPWDHSRKSMELEKTCNIDRKLLENSQAVTEDYKQALFMDYNQSIEYDRGHLLPVSHQRDWDSQDATFTLTNIVPQFRKLNGGKWAEYENSMKKSTNGCRDTYVLVGAVPGHECLNKRVNIPSHIWAAACCETRDNRKRSWAVIAENNQNTVHQHSVRELEVHLAKAYRKEINLFNPACYSGDKQPNNFTEQIQPGYKLSSLLV